MARNSGPFMQHWHFKLIADILRQAGERGLITEEAVKFFANSLICTNPNFDKARFIAACMGNHTTSKDKMR